MTDQELKKLRRSDLLELLIAQEKENEQLHSQISQLTRRLEDRTIALEQAGSIAEASLRINGVFQAAQDAAAQYLENIQRLSEQREKSCHGLEENSQTADQPAAETQETCRPMEEIPQKCREQLPSAHEESQTFPGNRGGKGVEV